MTADEKYATAKSTLFIMSRSVSGY